MKTQYVMDEEGKKVAVLVPIQKYKELIKNSEMLEDIRLYDEAKKHKQEFVDADSVFEVIEKTLKN